MFWVRSVYFNLRNILQKSGTFLPGHPVYVCMYVCMFIYNIYIYVCVCVCVCMYTYNNEVIPNVRLVMATNTLSINNTQNCAFRNVPHRHYQRTTCTSERRDILRYSCRWPTAFCAAHVPNCAHIGHKTFWPLNYVR